jgi:hypothetical protein
MRYSSKKGLWAVITLLGGASVLASACGGSGGDDRNGGASGSGNAPGGAGASATAGNAGSVSSTAGTGGGSATCNPATQCCATAKCACPYPAGDGTANAIANLEDGTKNFKPAGVATAVGAWDLSKDASAGTISPSGTATLATVDGGANGTTKAFHVTGTNLTGWGAALAAQLSNGCPFDGSKYGGISFWAKGTSTVLEGPNKLLVLVGMPEFAPKTNGGFCDEAAMDVNCYARHRVTITLTSEWKQYIVAWEDLQAPAYNALGPAFNANRIRDIVFNASGPSPDPMPAASFDFWVDELQFVPTGTKGNVGGGTAGSGAGGGSSAGAGGASTAGAGGASAGSGGAAAGSGGTAGT